MLPNFSCTHRLNKDKKGVKGDGAGNVTAPKGCYLCHRPGTGSSSDQLGALDANWLLFLGESRQGRQESQEASSAMSLSLPSGQLPGSSSSWES